MRLSNCFRSYVTVRNWLEKGIITKDNIVYMITGKCSLKGEIFKDFVEYFYDKFGNDGKEVVNRLIGSFGCKYNSKSSGYMTTEFEDI